MSDPYLGEIRIFAGNFAPRNWAVCNGQLLSISANTALFSLLGTTYGGDGRTTFALPNLQNRSPMQPGAGPGLTPRSLGETVGVADVTLTTAQMPAHIHALLASTDDDNTTSPASSAAGAAPDPLYRSDIDTTMSGSALGMSGGSQPHSNQQPYLGLTFIIALQGIYPPRS